MRSSAASLLFFLLVSTSPAPAASPDPVDAGHPTVRSYTDKDGLPQNSVMAMARDRRQYLWVGTQDGLAVYNGRDWRVVNLPDRTRSNFVRSMIVAADGALWCGRENGGVSRLKDGEWTTYGAESGLPGAPANCLLEATAPGPAEGLWVGTSGGAARFDGERWRLFTAASGLPSDTVLALAEAGGPGARTLWAGTSRGLARLEGDRWASVDLPFAAGEGVRCLYESVGRDGRRALWAGTAEGRLARLEEGAWRAAEVDAANAIISMAETTRPDGERALWVGTDGGGLWRFEEGRWRVFDTKAGMPNNTVWSLLPVDAPNGTSALWLGTDGGAGRMQLGRWTSFDTGAGLPTDSVYGLCETVEADGTRAIWIGTRGGGLARIRDGEWTVFDTSSGLPNNTVFSLFELPEPDGRRTLWAGTQDGLARFEGGRWRPVTLPGIPVKRVRATFEAVAPDGARTLWAASADAGLLRYRDGEWSAFGAETGLPTDNLFSVVETAAPGGGRAVWVGMQGGGVARLLDGRWTVWSTANSGLPNDSVLGLHEWVSPSGRRELWAGTEGGGAARLDLDRPEAGWSVLSDSTEPALPNNTVYQIVEDAQKRLYLTTNKGVARLTPRAPTADDTAEFAVYTFTTEDGLPSNEFNGGSSHVDGLGRIWAGTPAGAAVYDPSNDVEDSRARPLYVERGALEGSGRAVRAGDSLAHDENTLAFEYALLSYFREKETRYRTQLVGLEAAPSAWTAEHKRSYTTLPAGAYAFRVWARDHAGNVSGPVEVPFEIRPAPWQTWWAWTLYLAGLAAGGYLVVRYRLGALRRRNEELEAAIAERTAELAEKVAELELSERRALDAKEEALEANRAKSAFLSNMSHELRTPLNAVLGFSQLMERDGSISGESREGLGVIQRSGEHLLELINDVLSISKIEAGRLTLNEQTFDLPALLRGVEEMVRVRAELKGLRLVFDLAPGLPRYVRGDEGKLRQVLVNLLGNAVKFTEHGGVALRARWEGGRAFFEVEDTGHGIAPGELDGIFEAFAQSESGRKAKEGTGLGLTISRDYVRLMGGDLAVRSEVGRGTVFGFEVALAEAEEAVTPAGRRRVVGLEPGQPAWRVLVADDRWENRSLLVRLLRAAGFEAREAADGREAVERWAEWRPHFVWMDMRMPVMTGAEATREIRRREADEARAAEARLASSKIVALTASAFEHERGAVLEAGCDDFVTKPYREATIFEKLAEQLGARFVYASDGEPEPPPPEPGGEAVTPERFAALPRGPVAELHEALTLGNAREAQLAVEKIASHDDALAEQLRRLVRAYQFDEILDTIEAAGLG